MTSYNIVCFKCNSVHQIVSIYTDIAKSTVHSFGMATSLRKKIWAFLAREFRDSKRLIQGVWQLKRLMFSWLGLLLVHFHYTDISPLLGIIIYQNWSRGHVILLRRISEISDIIIYWQIFILFKWRTNNTISSHQNTQQLKSDPQYILK